MEDAEPIRKRRAVNNKILLNMLKLCPFQVSMSSKNRLSIEFPLLRENRQIAIGKGDDQATISQDGHGSGPFLPTGEIGYKTVKGHYRYSQGNHGKDKPVKDNTRTIQQTGKGQPPGLILTFSFQSKRAGRIPKTPNSATTSQNP